MIGKERSFVSERGKDLAAFGRECWNAASEFRADRLRNKRYTFGDQWRDPVTVDGHVMSEEEYIRREGNIPLKNNLIRRLVRNVVGVFRKEFSEQLSEWDAEERRHAAFLGMWGAMRLIAGARGLSGLRPRLSSRRPLSSGALSGNILWLPSCGDGCDQRSPRRPGAGSNAAKRHSRP